MKSKYLYTTIHEYINENIYNEIPQPFEGITVIAEGSEEYEMFNHYELPNEPILYIHSFFPKEEYKGKGLTKKYLLKILNDWINNRLRNDELVNHIGTRWLNKLGGSDLFATSSMYDQGEKFFNNLINSGYLEKVDLIKNGNGRAMNLFRITNKTKNMF